MDITITNSADGGKMVLVEGVEAYGMTSKTITLLEHLLEARQCDRVASRIELLHDIWGLTPGRPEDRTLDTHIKMLRKFVGKEAIETFPGLGYKLL